MRSPPDLLTVLDAAGHLRDVSFKKGEVILRPDSDQTRCFIIRSGLVKVYAISQQGEEEVQVVYSAGEMFPLYWLLGKPNSNSFFQAMSDCVVAVVAQATLNDLIETNLRVSNLMLRGVTEQFAIYAARVSNLGYKYGRERLAYRLLLMARRFGDAADDTGVVLLPQFSQQEIAATIHTARESVNRELSRFEKLGAIEHRKGRIAILKPDLLRKEIGDEIGHLFFDTD